VSSPSDRESVDPQSSPLAQAHQWYSLMLAHCRMAWAQLTEKLGRSGVAASRGRTGSLRTQSARHRVDHGTICRRSCANSGHYKPLYACVDRTFINPNLSGRRPENLGARTDANNGQSLAHTEWPARRLVVWCYSTSASLGRGVSTSAKYVSMSASREKWNREKAFNRSHL